jgi:fibronectin-binding autotransporter adhesin
MISMVRRQAAHPLRQLRRSTHRLPVAVFAAAVLLAGLGPAIAVSAPFTGTYTFGSAGNVAAFTYNGTLIPNLTVGDLTKVGVTTSSSSGNFRATNWPLNTVPGIDAGKYFEFTLTAASGYTFDMASLDFGIGRSSTGPIDFEWRSSRDSYATTLSPYTSVGANTTATGGVLTLTDASQNQTGQVLDLSGSSFAGLSAVTLRFFGYNAESASGTGGMASALTFSGTLNAPVGTTYTWTGNGSGGAWANGQQGQFNAPYADSGISVAEFAGTGETVTVNGAGVEAGQLQFRSTGYTLSGGTVTLGLGTITTDPGTSTVISAPLAGTAGLTKAGDGSLALSGANTFTGAVTITGGTVEIASDAALGDSTNDVALGGTLKTTASISLDAGRDLAGTGTLDIAPGTTLTVNGVTALSSLTLANTGTLAFNNAASDPGNITANYGSGSATISGAIDFGSADKVIAVAAGTLELSGPITQTVASGNEITKEGAGTLVLSGSGSTISRIQLGRAGTSPTPGGVLRVTEVGDLGGQEMFFNGGTIEPTAAIVSTISVSLSGRAADPSVIGGAGGNADLTLGAARAFGPSGTSGEIVLNVNNNTTFTGAVNLVTTGTISGWTVGGTGGLTLAGTSPSLTAPITLADSVTLAVTGSTANNITVGATNVLTGTGTIGGIVGGAGSVQPGASPGILTVGQVDPSGGTSFVLEYTGALPDYSNAAASGNDVVRVTNATPFVSSMTSSNTVDLFLGVTSVTAGNTFQGGFFTDTAADFTASVADATLNYYVLGDGNGSDGTLDGQGYYTFANWKASFSSEPDLALALSTIASTANFATGSVSGQAMVVSAVPEPSTIGLVVAAAGLASASLLRRRLRPAARR